MDGRAMRWRRVEPFNPLVGAMDGWIGSPVVLDGDLSAVRAASGFGLDVRLLDALNAQGYAGLFPVQAAVLEHLHSGGDLCVAAPTGSGKTLAYVLGILDALSRRVVVRLRALVIVPSRELAAQVQRVFEPFASSVGLRVGLATGQTSFAGEQRRLVGEMDTVLAGGDSLVDVLIATPGRLVEHIGQTGNFTLQHLRFLVIDEADRLLEQAFQNWLPLVLEAACGGGNAGCAASTRMPDAVSYRSKRANPFHADAWCTPLTKILLSATLTRNPAKIAALRLVDPVYLRTMQDESTRYSMPKELQQHMVVCADDDEKPLCLLQLLAEKKLVRSLCFTQSVKATERLHELLKLCTSARVAAFTGDLSQERRQGLLAAFNAGGIDVLVASDAAARGLDLENVLCVINYDVPVDIKSYVHRVGRTARAGAGGSAYTLVAQREVFHFKEMVKKAGVWELISKVRLAEAEEQQRRVYEEGLGELRRRIRGPEEDRGGIKTNN